MHVCIYVYMYACMYVCMYVCMCRCICMYVCMYACTMYSLIRSFQIPDCSTSLFVIAKGGLIFVNVLQSATSEISTQLKCDPL
jgi:hypothetical protein